MVFIGEQKSCFLYIMKELFTLELDSPRRNHHKTVKIDSGLMKQKKKKSNKMSANKDYFSPSYLMMLSEINLTKTNTA